MHPPKCLLSILPLPRGTITAIVGGGGKTALIDALAGALAGRGLRVVTTTTTKAYRPDRASAGRIVRSESLLDAALRLPGPVALVPLRPGMEKGPGLPPDRVERILASGVADQILVEADGSRGRPFKAYRPGEPVPPRRSATVIAVIGVDILGLPLGPQSCLRHERLHEVGLQAGGICGEEEAAILFGRLLSILRRQGPFERVVPLINKVEGPEREAAGVRLAGRILDLGDAAVEEVIVGSVREGRFSRVPRGERRGPPPPPPDPPAPS